MIQSNFFQRIFENFPEMRKHKNLIVRLENMENIKLLEVLKSKEKKIA